jgi:hypothetical protein
VAQRVLIPTPVLRERGRIRILWSDEGGSEGRRTSLMRFACALKLIVPLHPILADCCQVTYALRSKVRRIDHARDDVATALLLRLLLHSAAASCTMSIRRRTFRDLE